MMSCTRKKSKKKFKYSKRAQSVAEIGVVVKENFEKEVLKTKVIFVFVVQEYFTFFIMVEKVIQYKIVV